MRNFLIFLFCILISPVNAETVSWDSLSYIDIDEVSKRALEYLHSNSTKLKGVDLVVLEVKASYRRASYNKEGGKFLAVLLTAIKAVTDGKQVPIKVQTEKGEEELKYIIFDSVIVQFDDNGNPFSRIILGEKFFGTKEDLSKYLEQH